MLFESFLVLARLQDRALVTWIAKQFESFPSRRLDTVIWIATINYLE